MTLKAILKDRPLPHRYGNSVVRNADAPAHKKAQSHTGIRGRIKASIIRVNHPGPCTYRPVRIGIDGAGPSASIRRLTRVAYWRFGSVKPPTHGTADLSAVADEGVPVAGSISPGPSEVLPDLEFVYGSHGQRAVGASSRPRPGPARGQGGVGSGYRTLPGPATVFTSAMRIHAKPGLEVTIFAC